MTSTFFLLTFWSLKNRIRKRFQRLREPRYLFGFIVGAAYLYYFVFWRGFRTSRSGRASGPPADLMARIAGPMQFIGSVVLLVFAVAVWVWPGSRKPIEFSRAEVQFLFAAPVSRRQLLHYKLLRSQLGLLFGSAIATLILRPGSLAAGWTFLAGVWISFTIIRLHSVGVSLSRASLAQHGRSGLARQWVPLAIVLGALSVLIVTIVRDLPQLAALDGAGAVFQELQRLGSTGAAAIVLWPFHVIAALPFSGSASAFLRAMPAALAMLVLNYVWVMRADTAFEEAAADDAEKRARAKTAPRARGVKSTATPFTLALDGRPETAILWKNLILIGRFMSLKTLLRVAPFFVILAIALGQGGGKAVSAIGTLLFAVLSAYAVLLGPQLMRNDLRQDLANLALLKTWPVKGSVLLRGEILAPAIALTVIVWFCLGTVAVLMGGVPVDDAIGRSLMANRLSYAASAMVVAPMLILAQLVVHNGIAVMFPAWVTVGSSRARGIDAMGQRMLMLAGILLSLVVSLLPAVLLAGVVAGVIYMTTDVVLVFVPALIIAAVMFAECAIATEWIGRVLDRTDVSAIEATE